MGKVYRAGDPIVGREVAIKSLDLEEFSKRKPKEIRARFRREAQAVGQLNHLNIVTIFDVGESFFVMEPISRATERPGTSEPRESRARPCPTYNVL